MIRPTASLALLLTALLIAGCGGGGDTSSDDQATGTPYDAAIAKAQAVKASDFPPPGNQTLQQLAGQAPAINMGLATSIYTPGENRLAFGMIDNAQTFIYGPTAVYLARNPNKGKVLGPFPAPADPLVVKPPFRSQGAATATGEIAAIYDSKIDVPTPGRWYVLALTKAQGKRYGAAADIKVTADDPTPAAGEPASRVDTDTLASAAGNIEAIDTRRPTDDMHDVNLSDALGRKPVALLFATPQLCQTRVCGPVVDIAAQLKAKYGDQMDFIHQEVYVDNQVDKGLRPSLRGYKLTTEPWLFTIDANGRVADRLQGSFGTVGFERAIRKAIDAN